MDLTGCTDQIYDQAKQTNVEMTKLSLSFSQISIQSTEKQAKQKNNKKKKILVNEIVYLKVHKKMEMPASRNQTYITKFLFKGNCM